MNPWLPTTFCGGPALEMTQFGVRFLIYVNKYREPRLHAKKVEGNVYLFSAEANLPGFNIMLDLLSLPRFDPNFFPNINIPQKNTLEDLDIRR